MPVHADGVAGTKPMMAVADRIWGEIGYPMSKHALLKKPARK